MRLIPVKLTEGNIGRLQDFHCGDLPHEIPLATWVKEKALKQMKEPSSKTKAWLYELADDPGIDVGYGFLNLNWLKVDREEWAGEERIKIQVIQTMAVRKGHQGKGYAHEILNHLESEAIKRLDDAPHLKPLLALYVHPANEKGISLYVKDGFEDYPNTIPCIYTGADLQCMTKNLRAFKTQS